jgi:hypothetical protein
LKQVKVFEQLNLVRLKLFTCENEFLEAKTALNNILSYKRTRVLASQNAVIGALPQIMRWNPALLVGSCALTSIGALLSAR